MLVILNDIKNTHRAKMHHKKMYLKTGKGVIVSLGYTGISGVWSIIFTMSRLASDECVLMEKTGYQSRRGIPVPIYLQKS